MRIIHPPAKPLPRFEFTQPEIKALTAELHLLGFGRERRTPEHAKAFPLLDQFSFLTEELAE